MYLAKKQDDPDRVRVRPPQRGNDERKSKDIGKKVIKLFQFS